MTNRAASGRLRPEFTRNRGSYVRYDKLKTTYCRRSVCRHTAQITLERYISIMDIYELLKWDVFKVNKVENGIYMDSSKSDWNPRVNTQLLEKVQQLLSPHRGTVYVVQCIFHEYLICYRLNDLSMKLLRRVNFEPTLIQVYQRNNRTRTIRISVIHSQRTRVETHS